jgi:hypothetical protein
MLGERGCCYRRLDFVGSQLLPSRWWMSDRGGLLDWNGGGPTGGAIGPLETEELVLPRTRNERTRL